MNDGSWGVIIGVILFLLSVVGINKVGDAVGLWGNETTCQVSYSSSDKVVDPRTEIGEKEYYCPEPADIYGP
jgi:hypothetical protein